MLALPHTNSWGFLYTNQENGSATPGTSVTPGASDAEGSFTEIVADASVTTPILYASILVNGGTSFGQSKQHLLDIAYDPTGGTTYDQFVFHNLAVGGSAAINANNGQPRPFHFPCNIPAGSAIAARIQGSNGTAGTVRITATLYGKPSRPELWRPAAYSETLGYTSGTLGTSFTPGNAAWGSWASLGTTVKKHFWAQLGWQIDNAATSAHTTRIQLGIGDGTNMNIINDIVGHIGTNEDLSHSLPMPCTWEIPAGAELWVRGNNSAAPVSGYNATCVLFGG